jgi:hypothetical protein
MVYRDTRHTTQVVFLHVRFQIPLTEFHIDIEKRCLMSFSLTKNSDDVGACTRLTQLFHGFDFVVKAFLDVSLMRWSSEFTDDLSCKELPMISKVQTGNKSYLVIATVVILTD